MSDQHYVQKALGEVIRQADEKASSVEEVLMRQEQDLKDAARSCDETLHELDAYFASLSKQLERLKASFAHEVHKGLSEVQLEFRSTVSRINKGLEKLKELKEASLQVLNMGQCSNSDLVYQVHGCIFSINQDLDSLSEFLGNYVPLKFVGRLNFENFNKADIGILERLPDISEAEILQSKIPKIKLGRLFQLDFRISKKYCEAARKYITYSVTKDDGQSQKVCAYLQDNKNGTYVLSFPISVVIPHTVNIYYLGEHIKNSPYTISFKVDLTQMANIGASNQPSIGSYPTGSKELNTELPNTSSRITGRAMGDERDAFKLSKWQNHVENAQQNNNFTVSLMDTQSTVGESEQKKQ